MYEHSKLPAAGEYGDVGPSSTARANLGRVGSTTNATWAAQDHHPNAQPPWPQKIPGLRKWESGGRSSGHALLARAGASSSSEWG